MFFCAISGEPPQEPVVSTKSGHVYERRLITKYIVDNGTDPVTGEKLEESDLVAVKANPNTAPPRPPTLTSIPALLHTLQNEWDALMLETFALKQQYNSTRQELSHALYQQDAATRVVARLIRERDAAREALSNVQVSMGMEPSAPAADVDMDGGAAEEEAGLPAEVVNQINELSQSLSAVRKKRKPIEGYVSAANVKSYASTHTIPSLHSASKPGINTIALSTAHPTQFLTGGNDNIVQLYDRANDQVLATLKGHTKKVNVVALRESTGDNAPRLILSASADKTARIWAHDAASGEFAPRHTVKLHKGDVTGLAVLPTRALLGLSSADKTYSIHDLTTFQSLFRSTAGGDDPAFSTFTSHPDGTLIALGTPSGALQLFDIRTGSLAAQLQGNAGSPIRTASFSENGYQLAAPDGTSTVAIWDLRKQTASTHLDCGEGFSIHGVNYDLSAQFIGVAGSGGARVYAHKTWEELVRFEEGGEVADIAFGDLGKEIWGVSGREVRIWGASA